MGRTSTAREDLIAAASDLMWSRGFVDVGVAELCKAAAVRPGSFYHFFPSKTELGIAALDHHWKISSAHVLEPAAEVEDPVERLRYYFEVVSLMHAELKNRHGEVRGCPFGNLGGEASALEPELRASLAHYSRKIAEFFVQMASDAMRRGQSGASDADSRGNALLALVEGILILARIRNDADVIMEMLPEAEALLTS